MGQPKLRNEKKAPGTSAEVDNQGQTETCTSHALSKAGTEGTDDLGYDVNQEVLTALIINQYKDTNARWATDFHNTKILIKAKKKQKKKSPLLCLIMTIVLEECTIEDFKKGYSKKEGKFIVDYETDAHGPHCVFASKWDKKKKRIAGLNSWGDKQKHPKIAEDEVIKMYRVRVKLQTEENGKVLGQTDKFDEIPVKKSTMDKIMNKTSEIAKNGAAFAKTGAAFFKSLSPF